jgi:hypothetical protein
MAEAWGNVLDPPQTGVVAEVKPGDILAAMGHGIIKKGVTIKGGQGLLVAGQAIARETATKKYVKYATGGSGGADVCKGFLMEAVETGTGGTSKDKLANIVEGGTLKRSKLTDLDAAAITDLNGREDTDRDYFHF